MLFVRKLCVLVFIFHLFLFVQCSSLSWLPAGFQHTLNLTVVRIVWLLQMWALSPSIFSLFSEHLLLTNVSMMDCYPAAHYAMINAFYSHCSRFVLGF